MLSEEEDIGNSARSCVEEDPNFEAYLKAVKILHRVQVVVLVLFCIQLLGFVSLFYGWYSPYIYWGTAIQLIDWEFNETAIILIFKIVQLSMIIVTFRLVKKLNKISQEDTHSEKGLNFLSIIQVILLLLIPNYLNIFITIVLAGLSLRTKLIFKKT